MSDFYLGNAPVGRRLETRDRAEVVGTIDLFPAATAENVEVARRHYLEARPEDFDRPTRRIWRDRASGREYRRLPGSPLTDAKHKDDGAVFYVDGDVLVFLRLRGAQPADSVELGNLTSGEVNPRLVPANTNEPVIY